MQTIRFNLSEVSALVLKKWKFISIFTFCSLILAVIIYYFAPKYYKSESIVIPASPVLADKERLFNHNIQNLYSIMGNGDDIETLTGIATLDTVYYRLIDEFGMTTYYKTTGKDLAIKRKKTLKLLQKDIEVSKGEYNQLKIIVWTKDKYLSMRIANRLVELVQETEQGIWKQAYRTNLDQVHNAMQILKKDYEDETDSITSGHASMDKALFESKRQSILEQIRQYQQTENEWKLAIASTPAALYIVQKAAASAYHDKPLLINILITTCLIASIFASIAVLIYERKQLS